MNKNRKVVRKNVDNNESIKVHFELGRIDEEKCNAMKNIIKEDKKNDK